MGSTPVQHMQCLNSVLNVKAVVAAFNQEKALVGAFSVIANLRMDLFEALHNTHNQTQSLTATHKSCQRAAAVEENNNYPDKLPPYQLLSFLSWPKQHHFGVKSIRSKYFPHVCNFKDWIFRQTSSKHLPVHFFHQFNRVVSDKRKTRQAPSQLIIQFGAANPIITCYAPAGPAGRCCHVAASTNRIRTLDARPPAILP